MSQIAPSSLQVKEKAKQKKSAMGGVGGQQGATVSGAGTTARACLLGRPLPC